MSRDHTFARVRAIGRGGLLLAFALGASLTCMAQTAQRADAGAVARGERLYRQHCQRCHGQDGVGEPRVPWSIRHPDLIEAMPLDETSHAWHHSDEQLVETILDGNPRSRRRMPTFRGVLDEAQARDLVGYVKTFWGDRILSCQGPKHMQCL